jgi:hypothetical protein
MKMVDKLNFWEIKIFYSLLFIYLLCYSTCTVWGSENWEMPWYVAAAPVFFSPLLWMVNWRHLPSSYFSPAKIRFPLSFPVSVTLCDGFTVSSASASSFFSKICYTLQRQPFVVHRPKKAQPCRPDHINIPSRCIRTQYMTWRVETSNSRSQWPEHVLGCEFPLVVGSSTAQIIHVFVTVLLSQSVLDLRIR